MIGHRYNRLIVESFAERRRGKDYYNCLCDCGNRKVIEGYKLKTGHTKSCGCLVRENGLNNKTHGMTNTRLYRIYAGIKDRCLNKSNERYSDYGGRGIEICEEWLSDFMSFYNWAIDNGYSEELSIDRIDVDGNYEPNNCRWATDEEQANNKRNSHMIEFNGETKTLAQLSKLRNIPVSTLLYRLESGWSIKQCLNLENPPSKTNIRGTMIEYNGEVNNLTTWSNKVGINKETLRHRLKNGESIEEALDMVEVNRNRRGKLYNVNGEEKTLKELAEEHNISYDTLQYRVCDANWTIEEALGLVKRKKQHSFYVNGEYMTLTELAEEYSVSRDLLKYRIYKAKWSLPEALNVIPRKK